MRSKFFAMALCGVVLTPAAAAFAQWTPGSELVGQSLQVETNGVVNTVYFDNGGAARILTPAGNPVPATWSAANGQLCLNSGGAQECWPYASPMAAGQSVTLTSDCQNVSRWTSMMAPPPPLPAPQGERG